MIMLIFITLLIKNNQDMNLFFLLSIYSFVIVLLYLFLNSFDIAMTEGSIGIVISSLFILKFTKIKNINFDLIINIKNIIISNFLIFTIFLILFLVNIDSILLDQLQVSQFHTSLISFYYMKNTYIDISIKSEVAAILANYRGFDTLIETLVIFVASIGVLFLKTNKSKY